MLFTRMLQMLLKQHNLALTTVTGIPMKVKFFVKKDFSNIEYNSSRKMLLRVRV
jgi:hypothetical protein